AGALGVALGRPRAAVALPIPVAFGAAIVQPQGSEVAAALVAAGLVVAALAVSYGADLSDDGPLGASFERVRLLRSGGLVVALVVAVLFLNQFGFLFPNSKRNHTDPPQRPHLPPPVPDVPLFTVTMDQKVPLRLGVIDVYRDGAFMLPPNDTGRFHRLSPPASLDVKDKGELPPANPSAVPGPPVPPDRGRAAGRSRARRQCARARAGQGVSRDAANAVGGQGDRGRRAAVTVRSVAVRPQGALRPRGRGRRRQAGRRL